MHGHVQDDGRRQWRRPGWCVQELADGAIVLVDISGPMVMHGYQADHPQLGDEQKKCDEAVHVCN
jgi:hypothetical protein